MGGGTGAGMGTLLISKIREEYPDRVMSTGCRVEVGLGCPRKARQRPSTFHSRTLRHIAQLSLPPMPPTSTP